MKYGFWRIVVAVTLPLSGQILAGCGDDSGSGSTDAGSPTESGGTSGAGGSISGGHAGSTGGRSAGGNAPGTGGNSPGTGGTAGSTGGIDGGAQGGTSTGGALPATGGTSTGSALPATGGASTGGALPATGGASTGDAACDGGATGCGGTVADGGPPTTGGTPSTGGSAGDAAAACRTDRDCDADDECVGPTRTQGCAPSDCDGSSCPAGHYCSPFVGRCTPLAAPGGPCTVLGLWTPNYNPCPSGYYCGPGGNCRAGDPESQPCSVDSDCGGSLVCNFNHRCSQDTRPNSGCGFGGNGLCPPGEFCHDTGQNAQFCEPKLDLGSGCFDVGACKHGLFCSFFSPLPSSECTPEREPGEPCANSIPCHQGADCDPITQHCIARPGYGTCPVSGCDEGQFCTTVQENGVCRPRAACSKDGDCGAGERCEGPAASSSCVARACTQDVNCAGGEYCAGNVCRPPKHLGESCSSAERCDAATVCNTERGVCATLVEEDQSCDLYHVCPAPLACIKTSASFFVFDGVCVRPDATVTCPDGITVCPVAQFCGSNDAGASYVCLPRHALGEPCTQDVGDLNGNGCAAALFCNALGVCAKDGAVDALCNQPTACEPGAYCTNGFACAARIAAGGNCVPNGGIDVGCAEGAFCNPETSRCEPTGSPGQSCPAVGVPFPQDWPDPAWDPCRDSTCVQGTCAGNYVPCAPPCQNGEQCERLVPQGVCR